MLGKQIYAATDYYSPNRMMEDFKKATGKDVKYIQGSEERFKGALEKAGLPEFARNELYENMMFM